MNNLLKTKRLGRQFYFLASFLLIAIPCYYIGYWTFINIAGSTLNPHPLSIKLQFIGFTVSLLPLAALLYGVTNLRRLFALYREGIFFSFEQVLIFKRISKALFAWVLCSTIYESVKSVLFSIGNPPGERIISLTFSSPEITNLIIAAIVLVIARIMDEGRVLAEEQQLTI